jgi:hypothetical protein
VAGNVTVLRDYMGEDAHLQERMTNLTKDIAKIKKQVWPIGGVRVAWGLTSHTRTTAAPTDILLVHHWDPGCRI